jgi:iron complex transport system substrate-binding protein
MIHKKAHCLVTLLLGFVFACATQAETKQRIIATDSGSTLLLQALGYESEIVAIDVTSKLPNRPDIANIGYHRTLAAEGLLSLAPTLVVGSQHMGPPPTIKALEAAQIELVRLPSATTINELKRNITRLGNALSAAKATKSFLTRLDEQDQQLKQNALKKEKVAFLLNMDGHKMRLAGLDTSGNAMINLLGAQNIAKFKGYQNVSAESLLELGPTVLLVAGRGEGNAAENLMKTQTILQHSQAVQNNQIYNVDGSLVVAGLSVGAVSLAAELQSQIASK